MTARMQSAILLLLLVLPACGGSASQQRGSASRDQNPITLEEIESASATNAYELVQARRPAWLRTRGTQSFNEGARGVGGGTGAGANVSAVPGQTPILVYLGTARLGGTEVLRQIDLRTLGSIEYLSRSAADYRFGSGHLHGAIVLTPRN
jgi:hypothetical protein